jgi:hypothetical protein
MKVMIMIIREASMTVQNYVPTFKLLRIPKYKFKFRERTAIWKRFRRTLWEILPSSCCRSLLSFPQGGCLGSSLLGRVFCQCADRRPLVNTSTHREKGGGEPRTRCADRRDINSPRRVTLHAALYHTADRQPHRLRNRPVCVCVCVCVCVYTHTHMYVCMYVYMCTQIYTYVCIYVCIYVYTNIYNTAHHEPHRHVINLPAPVPQSIGRGGGIHEFGRWLSKALQVRLHLCVCLCVCVCIYTHRGEVGLEVITSPPPPPPGDTHARDRIQNTEYSLCSNQTFVHFEFPGKKNPLKFSVKN